MSEWANPVADCVKPEPAATENVVPDNPIPCPAEYVVFVSVGVIHDPSSRRKRTVPEPPGFGTRP